MDPKELDCQVTWAHSYEALPHSLGTQWSKKMRGPSKTASTQSILSSEEINIDKDCRIAHVLCDYAVLLHQDMHVCGVP